VQGGVAGPWHLRLPHFRLGFTPSAGAELQSEYFVAREDAVAALHALEPLRPRIAPLLFISEVRFVAADRLWLSPAYRRDSTAIHFTWKPDWPAVRGLLPEIEAALTPFEPRPHWGKLFTLDGAPVRARSERLGAFADLARAHDPTGKFHNDLTDRVVFGAA
jgi:xylitol oxidase